MSERPDLPISEQFRIVAKKWIDADAAASMLEECKSPFPAKRMSELGDMPLSRAQMAMKASDEWADYIDKMVKARERAALLKAQLAFIRMKHTEWHSENATRRAEMRL